MSSKMERAMQEKGCFGILQRVFPMGTEGLREVSSGCLECFWRVSCLRAALSTPEGLRMRLEMVDRAASKGMMGRLERWSKKKELSDLLGPEREKSK